MAVASWMLRSRTLRSSRYNRKTLENDEDIVKIDWNKDPQENGKTILLGMCQLSDITEAKRLNYLNVFVKLILLVNGNVSKIGYTLDKVLCCLRLALISDSTQIRSASLRAIRHTLRTADDVTEFNKLCLSFLVARSLDLTLKNDIERIQALRLIRKILMLCPSNFDSSMARSLISLANGGIEEKDRMLRACLAALSELCILNSELFIISGGVAAITRNLLECQTPRIAESLCGVLLLLLDRPITRNHAAVDLHCIAAPYCDFHYRHGWMDKNRDERELRFNCSRVALLSILRSWPGILHLCSPTDTLGLRAIVDILYLNQLEVRKAVLDLLYELLGLPQPEWTDELSVALSAVDPAEPQAIWRLNEGFVAAEGRSVLPHLARTTPSITDMHLSLLLYCFLETGLLKALAEVIATSDTFISVRATVLLGELLRLIQILLPPECCNITPALPNLLEHATRNQPQALSAVTALQQLHKLLKRRPASSSLYLDYILQSGNFMKSQARVERTRKYNVGHSRTKFYRLVTTDGDDVIQDTGVLSSKDAFTWNWNLVKIMLKGEIDFHLNMSEYVHRTFIKRLVEFYLPSNNRYSHMDLTTPKNTQGYTVVGVELINCLIRNGDPNSIKLIYELFADISRHIAAITTSKSAHDCLFSPQHMANTQCQTYFLFIGRLGSTRTGIDILHNIKIYSQLQELAAKTNHDCYVKLIVSSLDYSEAGPARDLLSAVLTCSNEGSRLYATQFLLVLLRAGLPHFSNWGTKLLAGQLIDKSRSVQLAALSTLHEACEVPMCLDHLIILNPGLLHLGEKGVLLLIRFLSTPNGYHTFTKNNFVVNEIKRWDEFFNFRYIRIIEGETADILTLHQRGDDGRYDKRMSSTRITMRKDLFLLPHLYGQLSKHHEGLQTLLEHGSVPTFIEHIEHGACENEHDILQMKAALWALGHLGSSPNGAELLYSKGALVSMIRIAEHCVVYALRATAFYGLGLVATTRIGADFLFKLGWVCTRHDRHDRWPVIEEEDWSEDVPEESVFNVHLGSDSEHTSSDHAFVGDFYLNIPDVDSSTTDDDLLSESNIGSTPITHQKSSTLPSNQSGTNAQHKRSLSESVTFEIIKSPDQKLHEKVVLKITDVPHRYRDNSITESTTSGVSSCDSVVRTGHNDRLHMLTPIPSSSSLNTLKTSGARLRRHSESARRISMQSTTPSDRSTVSPAGSVTEKLSHQDLIGYNILRILRRNHQPLFYNEDKFADIFPKFDEVPSHKSHVPFLDFEAQSSILDWKSKNFTKTYLDSMSLTSLSSVKKFSLKDDVKNKNQCYMGICLPRVLTDLFPNNQIIARRLSFCEKNLLEGRTSQNSHIFMSPPEKPLVCKKFVSRHDIRTCLNCCRVRLKQTKANRSQAEEASTSTGDTANATTLMEYIDLKEDILINVERLANPVWVKQAKQTLLQYKQRNPKLFQDICLYSEVCKMISENTYRLGPRRLLQELFLDVNFNTFQIETNQILLENPDIVETVWSDTVTESNYFLSNEYLSVATEQRKAELSNVASNNTIKKIYGFNITQEENNEFIPFKYEHRSPPLSSVKEENLTSIESLIVAECSEIKNNTTATTNKTDVSKTVVPSNIKTLDSLKLSYKENKFPIKNRNEQKDVIK